MRTAALLGAFLSMCEPIVPDQPKSCTPWSYTATVVADDGTRCRLYERECDGRRQGRTNCSP